MDNPWILFTFVSVFHVIGAAVLANALRQLRTDLRERDLAGCQRAFLIVWAALFGCLPFAIATSSVPGQMGRRLFVLGEVLVWVGTFLVVLLAQESLKVLLRPFLHRETLLMLFGGGFAIVGLVTVSFLHEEGGLGVLLGGGLFALVGGSFFAYGMWRLIRSTR